MRQMEFKSAREWLLDQEHREQVLKEVRHYLGYWDGPVYIVEAILMVKAEHPYEGDEEEHILLPCTVPDVDGLPMDAGAIYRVSDLPAICDVKIRTDWDTGLECIRDMSVPMRRQLLEAGKGCPEPVALEKILEPVNILCTVDAAAILLCNCIPAALRTEEAHMPPLVTAAAGEGDEMSPEELYIQYQRFWSLMTKGTGFLLRRTLDELTKKTE